MTENKSPQTVSNTIIESHGAHFREKVRTAAVFFAFSIGATILAASGRFGFFPNAVPVISIVSLFAGVVAWKYRRDATDLKENVDHFNVRVAERAYFLETMRKVLSHTDGPPYTRRDLVKGIRDWVDSSATSDDLFARWTAEMPRSFPLAPGRAYRAFRRLHLMWIWNKCKPVVDYLFRFRIRQDYEVARLIGSEDFQRLFVAHGIRHGVLEEKEIRAKRSVHKQIAYAVVGEPLYQFQIRRVEEG